MRWRIGWMGIVGNRPAAVECIRAQGPLLDRLIKHPLDILGLQTFHGHRYDLTIAPPDLNDQPLSSKPLCSVNSSSRAFALGVTGFVDHAIARASPSALRCSGVSMVQAVSHSLGVSLRQAAARSLGVRQANAATKALRSRVSITASS
jgi:hypothetical protein